MIYYDKIKEFLKLVEGKQQLRGYIPCHFAGGGTKNYTGVGEPSFYTAMGVSGVTVGTGVDLGQTDVATLTRLGVDMGIINSLRPYIGKKQSQAIEILHNIPLTISQSVADTLDYAMLKEHGARISKRYDADAGASAFEKLPWQAQTAIYSILYQRGTGSPKKFPNTWRLFVEQDWALAADKLCDGSLWDGYQNRRNIEGELLKTI